MIEYKFNEELQILEVLYEGPIRISDLMKYGNSVFTDESLPRDLRILTDAKKASYILLPEEIPQVVRMTLKHIKPYNKVKAAFIQSKPIETALSLLLELEIKSGKYKHSVFSSRQAALHWLLSG
jgi:hypothetical protein